MAAEFEPASSGGSLPVYEADSYGATLITNATDAALLAWNKIGVVGLPIYLDITTVPTSPKFIADGVYAVSMDLSLFGANQAGKFMWGQVGMGAGDFIFVTASTEMNQGAIDEEPAVAMTIVGRVSAGDPVEIYVGHDGANGSHFLSGITVQRLA
jgi:hypothetical protein